MNKAENKEPEKADLPKASPTAAPAHINPPANPPPVAEAAPIGPVPGIAPVDPKSVRDLAAQGLAPNVAIQPGMDLKAQRRAAREARASRDDLEENCYDVLDIIRVPNPDGSGKSLDQLRAETKLSDEDLFAALDLLEGQGLLERSTARGETLVYHARPGIPATPALHVP